MILKVKKFYTFAKLPTQAYPGDAGWDLYVTHSAAINPGDTSILRTGLGIEIPPGYEAQVRPRSGLALDKQLTVLNSPGTIDSRYRGEICVIMINLGRVIQVIDAGDKVAQMVINKLPEVVLQEVADLSDSERGTKGFGSSG